MAWVDALHSNLRDEFDRLRKLDVKFILTTLRHLALDKLRENKNEAYSVKKKGRPTIAAALEYKHRLDMNSVVYRALPYFKSRAQRKALNERGKETCD